MNPSAVPNPSGDPEKPTGNLEQAMGQTTIQDTPTASDPVSATNGNHEEKAVNTSNGTATSEAIPTVPDLPLSSADGPIRKPLGKPLATSKPSLRPELTPEQEGKYKTLLASVAKWTEIPESSARGAGSAALEDDERMFMTRDCLLRYLRADKWNTTAAETRLKNTLVWRREYGLKKITPDYIGVENETGKQLIMGWDNEGRPCQYMRPSKQNTERSPRQIEHLVFMLERSIDLMPPGQETLTLLINFAETKTGQGATLAQGKQTMDILQNHYPERLGRALVTNVPFYIWGFFKLITPFIDPLTREKIKFNEDSSLHVPKEQLLKESGGLVQFDYDHSEYWTALNALAAQKRAERKARWEKGGKRVGEYEMYLKGGQDKCLADVEKESSAPETETKTETAA